MKLSMNGLYNLGKSAMSNEKIYMTGEQIVKAYQTGSFKGLGSVQKGKLRKIARRILYK
jgi:hypothetical protein